MVSLHGMMKRGSNTLLPLSYFVLVSKFFSSWRKNKMSKVVKDQVFFYFFPPPPHLFSSSDTIRNNSLFPLNQSLNFLPSTLFLYSLSLKIQKEKIYINTLTSRVEIMNCLVSVYILLTGHLLGYKFFPFL